MQFSTTHNHLVVFQRDGHTHKLWVMDKYRVQMGRPSRVYMNKAIENRYNCDQAFTEDAIKFHWRDHWSERPEAIPGSQTSRASISLNKYIALHSGARSCTASACLHSRCNVLACWQLLNLVTPQPPCTVIQHHHAVQSTSWLSHSKSFYFFALLALASMYLPMCTPI